MSLGMDEALARQERLRALRASASRAGNPETNEAQEVPRPNLPASPCPDEGLLRFSVTSGPASGPPFLSGPEVFHASKPPFSPGPVFSFYSDPMAALRRNVGSWRAGGRGVGLGPHQPPGAAQYFSGAAPRFAPSLSPDEAGFARGLRAEDCDPSLSLAKLHQPACDPAWAPLPAPQGWGPRPGPEFGLGPGFGPGPGPCFRPGPGPGPGLWGPHPGEGSAAGGLGAMAFRGGFAPTLDMCPREGRTGDRPSAPARGMEGLGKEEKRKERQWEQQGVLAGALGPRGGQESQRGQGAAQSSRRGAKSAWGTDGKGRGPGARRGEKDCTAAMRPQLFFKQSMLEDPWKHLEG